jgi:hypothetical protein
MTRLRGTVRSLPNDFSHEPQPHQANADGQAYPKHHLDLKPPHTRDPCFVSASACR